jgi:hypothetical protein
MFRQLRREFAGATHVSSLLGSRHIQIAIAGFLALGVALALALNQQSSRIDRASRGLNPNSPGFNPQVVILSGTIGDDHFEIRMRGADYYYCRRWNHGDTTWHLALAIPGFSFHRALVGSGGGGGSWSRPEDLVLARRLWNGTNFVGAKIDETVAEQSERHVREEFQDLEHVGSYLIPKRIIFSDRFGWNGTYIINKMEFGNDPSTNWFWAVKHENFDPGSFIRTKDLGEPGRVIRRN